MGPGDKEHILNFIFHVVFKLFPVLFFAVWSSKTEGEAGKIEAQPPVTISTSITPITNINNIIPYEDDDHHHHDMIMMMIMI